jgi:AraC-like DNA-binding protein
VTAFLVFAWPLAIDFILIAVFLGYGVALLRLGARKSNDLTAIRLGDETLARRALLLIAAALLGSGLFDIAVLLDFTFAGGVHAARIVAIESVLVLAIAGGAAAFAGHSRPAPERPAEAPSPVPEATETDAAILATVDRLMREKALYRDPDLTLDRLARRAAVPARQISAAVNRAHRRNVSQFVNAYRVAEAKRLLAETDAPVTEIMFQAGFQTKSNFNREFKRVTGLSPSTFRTETPANRTT